MVATVLGIDPSYSCSGLTWLDKGCKVHHFQTITVPPSDKRMVHGFKRFYGAIQGRRPAMAVVEDVAYGCPSRTTLVKLVKLLALVELALQALDIPYLVVSVTGCRKWLTGSGRADKPVVAKELKRRFGVVFADDKGHDLSDAALLSAWAIHTKGALCG